MILAKLLYRIHYVGEISCLYQVDSINHVALSFHKKDDLMYGTKNSIHPLTYRYCQGGPAKGTDMNLMSAAFDLVHLFNKSGKADVIRAKKALNCLWCHSLQHSDNSP